MSNFFSLNTALTGLRAAQVALETSTHNVANANTKGYTRQRVEQVTRLPYNTMNRLVGTGVEISGITRARNGFLDARARAATAEFRTYDALASLLQRTEAITGEPDNGVTAEVNELWAAFEDLGLDPSDLSARRQVISSLDAMASRVRSISGQWDLLAADTDTRVSVDVDEVNDALRRLGEINMQIPLAGARGAAPNDLLNERDLLLDKLVGMANVTVSIGIDDTVNISLPAPAAGTSVTLVALGQPTDTLVAGAGGAVTSSATGDALTVGGQIGGHQRFLQSELPAVRAEFEEFVETFTNTINAQHAAGYRASDDGTASVAGGPLLSYNPALGLSSFAVAVSRPEEIATAAAPGAGGPPATHDGRNAEALAGFRTNTVTTTSGGVTVTGTLDDRLRKAVVSLGRSVSAATRNADSAEGLVNSSELARQSVHGVSIDEEMVSLVAYQRAMEASSRVMTAIDEMLDVLINRTGTVGR